MTEAQVFSPSIFDMATDEEFMYFIADPADQDAACHDHNNPCPTEENAIFEEEDDNEDYSELGNQRTLYNPKPKSWKERSPTRIPHTHVDKARMDAWDQAKKEVEHIRKKVGELFVPKHCTSIADKVCYALGGERSDLFLQFTKVLPAATYDEFVQFSSAFFLSSHMKQNYTDLCDSPYVKTDEVGIEISAEEYNRIWREMEEHNRGNAYKERTWMMFENAFNTTMKDKFVPSPDELPLHVTLDDDKNNYAFGPTRKVPPDWDSRLAHKRHHNDNKTGETCHCACLTASGLPLQIAFEQVDAGSFNTVIELFKRFITIGPRYPNGRPELFGNGGASLYADRGYLRVNLLAWWLAAGGHVLGTTPRQPSLLYTFGKKEEETRKSGQKNIQNGTQKVNYQASYNFNSGGASRSNTTSGKRTVTSNAYVNGRSSVVNLSISSHLEHQERGWDHVSATAADLSWYHNKTLMRYERIAKAFELIEGKKDPIIAALEEYDEKHPAGGEKNEATRSKEREDIVKNIADGHLEQNGVEPVTCNQLCAAWFAYRCFCQTSSTTFEQFKILLPTIGTEHELREDYEILAKYANMTKKLRQSAGVVPDDEEEDAEDDDESLPPLVLTKSLKKLFMSFLNKLGEQINSDDDEVSDDDDDDEASDDEEEVKVTGKASRKRGDIPDAPCRPANSPPASIGNSDDELDQLGCFEDIDNNNADTAVPLEDEGGPASSPSFFESPPNNSAASAAENENQEDIGGEKEAMNMKGGGGGSGRRSTRSKTRRNTYHLKEPSSEDEDEGEEVNKIKVKIKVDGQDIYDSNDDCSASSESSNSSGSSRSSGSSDSSSVSGFSESKATKKKKAQKQQDYTLEAQTFIDIFERNYHGSTTAIRDETSSAFREAVEAYIDTADIECIHSCMKILGAKRKSKEAKNNLKAWVNGSDIERPLIGKSMDDLKETAKRMFGDDHGITGSRIDNFRKNLVAKLNELHGIVDENDEQVESTQYKLMVQMLRNSFMKGLSKSGKEEGSSKYTIAGQRAEEVIMKEFYQRLPQDKCNLSLYRPGLVRRDAPSDDKDIEFNNSVRTSADGLLVLTDAHNHISKGIPIEVKASVSSDSFHLNTRRLYSVRNDDRHSNGSTWKKADSGTMNMEFGKDKDGLPEVHPNLHKLNPDGKWLMQSLHHAYVYGTNSCYLVIGDKRSYMGSVRIVFPERVLKAYENILRHSYKESFSWAFVAERGDDNTLPEVPDIIFQAFKDKKLKDLNMTKEAFLTFFGLWWSVNVDYQVELPLPRTSRIVPLIVAVWNAMKGGSDTITKLIEASNEHIGIRTENNVVLARILLYYGVTFHRIMQAISGNENLDDIPTLAHYRGAANKRWKFSKSLQALHEALRRLSSHGDDRGEAEELPNPFGAYAPSPEKPTENRAESSPQEYAMMPAARSVTGTTPGQGRSLDVLDSTFAARCAGCTGVFISKKVKPPENNRDNRKRPPEDAIGKTNKKQKTTESTDADDRMRSKCLVCGALSEYMCHGCGGTFCLKPPNATTLEKTAGKRIKLGGGSSGGKRKADDTDQQDGTSKKKKKKKQRKSEKTTLTHPEMVVPKFKNSYEKIFYVDMPLTKNGNLYLRNKEVQYSRVYGELTCYHIAHKEAWKKHTLQHQAPVVTQIKENQDKKEKEKKSKKQEKKPKRRRRDTL